MQCCFFYNYISNIQVVSVSNIAQLKKNCSALKLNFIAYCDIALKNLVSETKMFVKCTNLYNLGGKRNTVEKVQNFLAAKFEKIVLQS